MNRIALTAQISALRTLELAGAQKYVRGGIVVRSAEAELLRERIAAARKTLELMAANEADHRALFARGRVNP